MHTREVVILDVDVATLGAAASVGAGDITINTLEAAGAGAGALGISVSATVRAGGKATRLKGGTTVKSRVEGSGHISHRKWAGADPDTIAG